MPIVPLTVMQRCRTVLVVPAPHWCLTLDVAVLILPRQPYRGNIDCLAGPELRTTPKLMHDDQIGQAGASWYNFQLKSLFV